MRSLKVAMVLTVGLWALFAFANRTLIASDGDSGRITLLDDCDPRIGAGWNTLINPNGCGRQEGSVSRPEFLAFLRSPFSASVIGHPSWRIAPMYAKPEVGETVSVQNDGGRSHTFTEVANYGGGFVAVLNIGLTPAPECAAAAGAIIPPGGRMDVTGLSGGNHKFQCCIHPWMRALVKVLPDVEN